MAFVAMASLLASSGFWAFLQHKTGDKNVTTRLLMGLAYYKITTLGLAYIERGWITKDELEEYQQYFFDPYKALGGNGVAERIWMEVTRLPFRPYGRYEEEVFRYNREHDERYIRNVPVNFEQQREQDPTAL